MSTLENGAVHPLLVHEPGAHVHTNVETVAHHLRTLSVIEREDIQRVLGLVVIKLFAVVAYCVIRSTGKQVILGRCTERRSSHADKNQGEHRQVLEEVLHDDQGRVGEPPISSAPYTRFGLGPYWSSFGE
ncbi:Hypothetical protein MSYG_4256 [Malassezia sympodialis ATCC 42132]|uniref:Uncharacterized protein n=1 Tax=Malassezia sympodialis (strain ATCC 42132) TaxID=1230383 RepID=A0A1M8ABS3_MALS4|nr:Hypothetical protein MSYG_4256 [Malassezia sympodialis ATCC 42132]